MEKQLTYEIIGYFKDYYIEGKYIGSIVGVEKDREKCGYTGRQVHIANSDIILDKNKKIKAGTEYSTQLMPLCGKSNLRNFLQIGK